MLLVRRKIKSHFVQSFLYYVPYAVLAAMTVPVSYTHLDVYKRQALAAINIAYPLTAFLQAVGTGIGMGGAIQYAICLGGQEAHYKDRYFGLSLLLLCAAGLALTLGLLLCTPALLCLLGAGGGILALGQEYLRFIALGAIFQVIDVYKRQRYMPWARPPPF